MIIFFPAGFSLRTRQLQVLILFFVIVTILSCTKQAKSYEALLSSLVLSFAEATDDVPKNISCVKRMTTYYSTKENISEEGKRDKAYI